MKARSHKRKRAKPLDDHQQQQLYERVEALRTGGKSAGDAKRQVADEYRRSVASVANVYHRLRRRAPTQSHFPRPKRVNVEMRRSQVLACVNEHERSTISDLFTRTDIPKLSLYKLLNSLMDEGAIIKRGQHWLPARSVHHKRQEKPIRPIALERPSQPDNRTMTLRLSVAALRDPEALAIMVRYGR
jgi:uncharacterized protein YoaH (UPF0181 family)